MTVPSSAAFGDVTAHTQGACQSGNSTDRQEKARRLAFFRIQSSLCSHCWESSRRVGEGGKEAAIVVTPFCFAGRFLLFSLGIQQELVRVFKVPYEVADAACRVGTVSDTVVEGQ
jgi:hypothetical protein